MSLLYRIIEFLIERFATISYVILWILLIGLCLWSAKDSNKDYVSSEEMIPNKRDTIICLKEQSAKSLTESNVQSEEIDSNLNIVNLHEKEKMEKKKISKGSLTDILVRKCPTPKNSKKSKSYSVQKADSKYVNNKKLPKDASSSKENIAFKETGFGYLTVSLENAYEYGYGYVIIDGNFWKKDEYNTTPLKILLPVGNHKVQVQRDGFVTSPEYVTISVEKDAEKQVSFILVPKTNE